MKKLKRNYQKAIYTEIEATVLFFRQGTNPRRWRCDKDTKKRWFRFVLLSIAALLVFIPGTLPAQ